MTAKNTPKARATSKTTGIAKARKAAAVPTTPIEQVMTLAEVIRGFTEIKKPHHMFTGELQSYLRSAKVIFKTVEGHEHTTTLERRMTIRFYVLNAHLTKAYEAINQFLNYAKEA